MAEQQVDITRMSLSELKAFCYDNLCKVNMYSDNVKAIEQEIAKRMSMPGEILGMMGSIPPPEAPKSAPIPVETKKAAKVTKSK